MSNHAFADLNRNFARLDRYLDRFLEEEQTEELLAKIYTSLFYHCIEDNIDTDHRYICEWAANVKLKGITFTAVRKAWAGYRFETICRREFDLAQRLADMTWMVHAAMGASCEKKEEDEEEDRE